MSKRKLVLSLIALLILGSFGAYFFVKQRGGADVERESVIKFSVNLGFPIIVDEKEEYARIKFDGLANYDEIGKPNVPIKNILLYIPPGYSISENDIVLKNIETKTFSLPKKLIPVQEPHLIGEEIKPTNPDDTIYSQNKLFPTKSFKLAGVNYFRNRNLATLIFYPLQYNPVSGEVNYIAKVDFEIKLDAQVTRAQKEDFDKVSSVESIDEIVREQVINPQNMPPSTRGQVIDQLDYLIITRPIFKPSLEKFKALRESQGKKLEIVTIEEIEELYKQGVIPGDDAAERMKEYIKKVYLEKNIKYVILAGDTDTNDAPNRSKFSEEPTSNFPTAIDKEWEVPIRYADNNVNFFNFSEETKGAPSDFYFADLDSTWILSDGKKYYYDADNNYSAFPEIFVGRFPAQTVQDMDSIVEKYASFKDNEKQRFLSMASWITGENDPTSSLLKNLISDYIFKGDATKLYDSIGNLNRNQLIQTINQDYYQWINYFGHGGQDMIDIEGGQGFTSADVNELTNMPSVIFYSNACLTGALDFDNSRQSLGESFINSKNKGSLVFIGNTRKSFIGGIINDLTLNFFDNLSIQQDWSFWKHYFTTQGSEILPALYYAFYLDMKYGASQIAYNRIITEYFGDPGFAPKTPDVTIDWTKPTSQMNSLPTISNTKTITLSWQGNDQNGSGIREYKVHYKKAGSSYWNDLYSGSDTSIIFTGEEGATYHFKVTSFDNALNREDEDWNSYEALTTITAQEQDTESPSLSHTPPSSPQPSTQDLKLSATITDNSGTISEAKIYFKNEGQTDWKETTMSKKDGDNWEGVITKNWFFRGRNIQYYIQAKDAADNVATSPSSASTDYHSVILNWPAENLIEITNLTATVNQNSIGISYNLSAAGSVTVNIKTVSGVLIKNIINNVTQNQGTRYVTWNGKDSNNVFVPPGTYLIEVTARRESGGTPTIATRTVSLTQNDISRMQQSYSSSPPIDNAPPIISHSVFNSAQPSTQDLKIQAAVTDNVGVTEAKTFYRAEGISQWQNINLTKKDGNNYESTIPKTAFVNGKKMQYYLSAKDAASNNAFNPAGAPNSYHSVGFNWPPPDTAPPTISNIQTSNIARSSATVSWTTSEPATSRVEYGLTNSYGLVKENDNLIANHSINLTGLRENTTYHYRVISKDAAGNQVVSGSYRLKTLDVTPPTITGVKSEVVSASAISIKWNTNEKATTTVQYGLDASYSYRVSNNSLVTSHRAVIGGLKFNAVYHYRVISKDASGNQNISKDYQFKITDAVPPIIANVQVKYFTQNSVTVYWETSEKATGRVEYGLTANYGIMREDGELKTLRYVKLEGLQPNTAYHYRVISKDAAGNQAASTDSIFRTPSSPDNSPPVILNVKTKDCSNGSTKYVCVMFQTDEPTRTSIQFGLTASYGQSVAGELDYQTGHTGTILVQAGKAYHYRIVAKDKTGNKTVSKDYQFSAP